jgi:hypothetical protein
VDKEESLSVHRIAVGRATFTHHLAHGIQRVALLMLTSSKHLSPRSASFS